MKKIRTIAVTPFGDTRVIEALGKRLAPHFEVSPDRAARFIDSVTTEDQVQGFIALVRIESQRAANETGQPLTIKIMGSERVSGDALDVVTSWEAIPTPITRAAQK